jgi:D-alanyl-D-alanine dipeptidase
MIVRTTSIFIGFVAALIAQSVRAQDAIPLVDIQKLDPTIVVELRYATSNNITGRPLYPPGTRAFVRPEVAQRLVIAQRYLRGRLHGLKIWDAYRPRHVQMELWRAARRNTYLADPATINGSLHAWGLAVDATLVDQRNQPVKMPTDYDDFTPAAFWRYQGSDPFVRSNLALLQAAMNAGGFYGLSAEWWHFVTPDWKNYVPDPDQIFTARRRTPKSKS